MDHITKKANICIRKARVPLWSMLCAMQVSHTHIQVQNEEHRLPAERRIQIPEANITSFGALERQKQCQIVLSTTYTIDMAAEF